MKSPSRAGQVPPRGDDQGEAHEGESRGDQPRDLHRPRRHAVIQAPITSADDRDVGRWTGEG
jgi:hypothetical protein